tara:strand:- start:254 stop:895 length:642 start_codon:yes stop_codon:yes gene_type:complete
MSATHNELQASPKGTARFPYLNTPDYEYASKYSSDPEYKTQLVPLNNADGEKFKAHLEKLYEDRYQFFCKRENKKLTKTQHMPWVEVTDPDTGEPTGQLAFKFKLKEQGTNRKTQETWTNSITWKNAGNVPIQKPEDKVGAGSEIQVGYEPAMYLMGNTVTFSLRIKIIKLNKLKTFTQGGDLGEALFEAEDGYEGTGAVEVSDAEVFSGSDF